MSFSAITDFFRQVSQDSTLKDKVQEALDQRAEAAAFEIVKIAKDRDLEFSATELREYLAGESSDTELSEDQLAAVAGGVRYLRTSDLSGLRSIRTLSYSDLRAARQLYDGRV
jgi:predicted ribosomally synthesized peptide with nif11-like leader